MSGTFFGFPRARTVFLSTALGVLFLGLLMLCLRTAMLAVFLKFYFLRDEFSIFTRPVISALALFARQLDELILRHRNTIKVVP